MVSRERLQQMILDRCEPEPNTGCWLWKGSDSWGYGYLYVGRSRKRAHRVSYEAFVGVIPEDAVVMHDCDVRCCVNPEHLTVGTQAQNIQDCYDRGRGPQKEGEHHHLSKLSNNDVRDILFMKSCGYSHKDIALNFPVGFKTIEAIVNNRMWRHI